MTLPAPLTITAATERFPIAGGFAIARGSKTEAVVTVATLTCGTLAGRGECVPYARYGETPDSVMAAIAGVSPAGLTRETLPERLPAGAARNALDCALWDIEAKHSGRPVAALLGAPHLSQVQTAITISLDTPAAMAGAAARRAAFPLLKLKLGGGAEDDARVAAVRAARPDARLIVDANEGWTMAALPARLAACAAAGVELVEQPLPAGADAALAGMARAVPLCADESMHDAADVRRLLGLYDAVNIKLDKTGGLTAALDAMAAARAAGLRVMVGCMVATSLGMAPAIVLAQHADWVDLDGALLLAQDRPHALHTDGPAVFPAAPELWG